MRSFFIGLQFLTRISLVKQVEWTEEDFGESVRWFPLIGAVLGLCYAGVAGLLFFLLPMQCIVVPQHVCAAMLLVLTVLLTGGIFCDGFMDSMDGIFSGRSREKMLEIMKDSRVGANGVMAFVSLMLLEWSLFLDMDRLQLLIAVFIMPIISRMMVVMAITCFPYARPNGMGKAFATYAGKEALLIAMVSTIFLVFPLGRLAVFAFFIAACFAWCFCRYVTKLLGGLTGDIYGATAMLAELVVLFSVLAGSCFL